MESRAEYLAKSCDTQASITTLFVKNKNKKRDNLGQVSYIDKKLICMNDIQM